MSAPATEPRMSELAAYIDRYLHDHDISAREAARRWGLSHVTLGKLFSNPDQVPDLRTLKKLAEGMSVTLGNLVALCGFSLGEGRPSDQALVGLTDDQVEWWLSIPPSRRADLLDALQRLHGGGSDPQ